MAGFLRCWRRIDLQSRWLAAPASSKAQLAEKPMADRPVDRSYQAKTPEEARSAYDDWAECYEADLCATGYRIPAMIAAVFTRYVPADAAPILDAGCGGGIQAEPLAELGFGPMTGIDLSDGMLGIARNKALYAELKQQVMGERLDFEDNQFAAIICSGVITPGHAPAHSFQELVRVARPGARIVFSLRSDDGQKPEYPAAIDGLTQAGAWTHVFSTKSFHSMPYGEPDVLHQVHVYEVL